MNGTIDVRVKCSYSRILLQDQAVNLSLVKSLPSGWITLSFRVTVYFLSKEIVSDHVYSGMILPLSGQDIRETSLNYTHSHLNCYEIETAHIMEIHNFS